MNIGSLNKRILLQYEEKTSDGMGGFTSEWKEGGAVWAAIWPVSANEQIQAMQNIMTISHRIRIRYRSDIKPYWRIQFKDRYFEIKSIVDPNEKHAILDLMVKEISA